ncbi:MAG: FMN-binding protein [Negativicutes bacterium]|nr:FMN-binding protein [Negativicutes bacterium]
MGRFLALLVMLTAIATMISGCGSSHGNGADGGHNDHNHSVVYKDGTYVAKSSPDERGAVGEIAITIEKGKISKTEYKGIQKDGKIKDKEYGMTNGKIENQDYYDKAQLALKATGTYTARLVETQSVAEVDAISGATVSFNQFTEAAKKALGQAK